MALELKITYKDGSACHVTDDLNEEQAKSLIRYMKSGKNLNGSEYEKAVITVKNNGK
ncbi:MAG: hypothetical protein MRERV_16c032 [Mycoplasmataceae bacterium RV_VA103A]|nr:MAG: hypothetical protein MRERV_16c032 [Mycoplasmataceae bacterium RV_VA103A]